MPPKQAASKKSQEKAKAKVVEDKTFGLKNKNKSKKVASYVEQVKKQVESAGNPKQRKEVDKKAEMLSKKEEEERRKAELALLYKPVQKEQKIAPGVDPKSVLCQYFKAGACQKGAKCKFSHDLAVERKSEKIDLYTDARKDQTPDDTMDKWDQAKLEEVVTKKQKGQMPQTDIICKYFLDAVENSKYGWFWECPNGVTCHYRHALPPGFVLKKDKKKEDKEQEDFSLEEWIESERHKLTGDLTPVTLESFQAWKKARIEKKEADEKEKREKKDAAFKAGKMSGLSGRDLFTYRPDLFVDDEEAAAGDIYATREDGEQDEEPQGEALYNPDDVNNDDDGEPSSSAAGEISIDENLFVAEDLEDLDLEDLDLEDEEDDEENGAEDDDDDEESDGAGPSSSA